MEENATILKNKVNIAIWHHPIEDFSSDDKASILDLFSRYNIGLYFCGHRHRSSIEFYREKDVLQLTCPGAYYDGYSVGGYVYGIVDTDTHFYKTEFYKWDEGSWYIESALKGTNEKGIYYFDTKKFKHNIKIAAADFCVMGSHVASRDIALSIGCEEVDVLAYSHSNLDVSSVDWELHQKQIKDFAVATKHMIGLGNAVYLFPMAPIPMLVSLGCEMQKNSKMTIYQYDRNSEYWVCREKDDAISCSIEENMNGYLELALKISCSFKVLDRQIEEALPNLEYDTIDVTSSCIKPGYPLHYNDVLHIVTQIFDRLNEVATQYRKIHIFAAIPAGMAVEIGRNLLESVYCDVITYQMHHNRYVKAIVINPTEHYAGE